MLTVLFASATIMFVIAAVGFSGSIWAGFAIAGVALLIYCAFYAMARYI
jgi:hypothetical protein